MQSLSKRDSHDKYFRDVAFLTPANAMLSVELTHLADMLTSVNQHLDIASEARESSSRISKAIWDTTVSSSSHHLYMISNMFHHSPPTQLFILGGG